MKLARSIINRSESVSSLTSERVQIAPRRLVVKRAECVSTKSCGSCAARSIIPTYLYVDMLLRNSICFRYAQTRYILLRKIRYLLALRAIAICSRRSHSIIKRSESECSHSSERVQIAPRRLDEGEQSAKHQTERLRRKGVIALGMNWLRHEIPTRSFASLEDDTSGEAELKILCRQFIPLSF